MYETVAGIDRLHEQSPIHNNLSPSNHVLQFTPRRPIAMHIPKLPRSLKRTTSGRGRAATKHDSRARALFSGHDEGRDHCRIGTERETHQVLRGEKAGPLVYRSPRVAYVPDPRLGPPPTPAVVAAVPERGGPEREKRVAGSMLARVCPPSTRQGRCVAYVRTCGPQTTAADLPVS